MRSPDQLFSLVGKVAVVTGGTGVLGGALACGLAMAGAEVGVLGRSAEKAEQVIQTITGSGGRAFPLLVDVTDKAALTAACQQVIAEHGHVDILVNAAGGNLPDAIIKDDLSFFDMTQDAFERVIALNLTSTMLCCQVFGEAMAQQGSGSIINISSMAADKPLTRVLGYGNAKAAVDNLTQWLAVEFAQRYGAGLRVNAIAPGFFVGEQNRSVLLNEDGSLTLRAEHIIAHTPMARFGDPDDLIGTAIWLASDAAKFVTGVIVPVDGGFSAYHGI